MQMEAQVKMAARPEIASIQLNAYVRVFANDVARVKFTRIVKPALVFTF
jgi:hypothetical protein